VCVLHFGLANKLRECLLTCCILANAVKLSRACPLQQRNEWQQQQQQESTDINNSLAESAFGQALSIAVVSPLMWKP
jgi:hypothetical protein